MIFYKNNAYPEIFLHDCRFELEYENKILRFIFKDGFCKEAKDGIEIIKGCIQISNISPNEVTIRHRKNKRGFGKHRELVSVIDFADLKRLTQNRYTEVIDEYYSSERLLYRCGLYPCDRNNSFELVDIEIDFGDGALEYYVFNDVKLH